MTEWSDAEISRRLALAIGWEPELVRTHLDSVYAAYWPNKATRSVLLSSGCYPAPMLPWRKFDYRDPAVYAPIAERFDCFPEKLPPKYETWTAWLYTDSAGGVVVYADTAAKAVALAVIKAKEQT